MSAPSSSAPAAASRTLLFALMVPLFMALMAVSVVNVALAPMSGSLGASSSETQWVVSGYALAFAVPLVAAGRIGDATGRRPGQDAGCWAWGGVWSLQGMGCP